MTRKRPERTARRAGERQARKLVREQQALSEKLPGGARDRPISVVSSSVIEVRARSMRCPLCEGEYQVDDHTAEGADLRAVHVTCRLCGVKRSLWFSIAGARLN